MYGNTPYINTFTQDESLWIVAYHNLMLLYLISLWLFPVFTYIIISSFVCE